MTKKSILAGCFSALLSWSSNAPSAKAQDVGELFLGIIGSAIIAEGQNQARQQARQQQASARAAMVRRVQTALKTLGFYDMSIDGASGPGTRNGIRAYLQAFNLSDFEFTTSDVELLESIAASGFRSANERNQARRGGFNTREDLIEAQTAGYTNFREFINGRNAGARNAAEYRQFENSGFASISLFRSASRRGFTSQIEMQNAEAAGFQNASNYREFVQSGAPDKATFLAERESIRAAQEARQTCLALRPTETSNLACAEALTANPRDRQVRTAYQNVAQGLELALRSARATLSNMEENSQQAINTSMQIDTLTAHEALLRCTLGAADASLQSDIRAIQRNCTQAGAGNLRPDILALIAVQLEELREQQIEEAEQEKSRLAAVQAREEAMQLMQRVAQYNASGGQFAEALDVARAISRLQSAISDGDPEELVRTFDAARGLTYSDVSFAAFVDRAERAELEARAAAVEATRRELQRYSAFLSSHISANMLDANTPELLEILEKVEDILSVGGPETLVIGRSDIENELRKYELLRLAETFELEREEQEASLAQIGAEGVAADEAKGRAEALLEDLRAFIDVGNTFGNAMEVARAAQALMSAVQSDDQDEIERALTIANNTFSGNSDFSAFRSERDQLNDETLNNALAVARARAKATNEFIIATLARNPLDPNLPSLLELNEDLETALASGDLQQVSTTQQRSENILSELGLSSGVQAAIRGAELASATEDVAQTENGLAITALNQALFEGPEKDILVLENRTSSAPSINRNLRDELTFGDVATTACWGHSPPKSSTATRITINAVNSLGARLTSEIPRCDIDAVLNTDLVLLQRGEFLKEPANYASLFSGLFESGDFSILETYSGKSLAEQANEFDRTSEYLILQLQNQLLEGFGYLALSEGQSSICRVEPIDIDARVMSTHLSDQMNRIEIHTPISRATLSGDADWVYATARNGRCNLIQAEERAMRELVAAFARNGVEHRLIPVWADSSEITRIEDLIANQDANQATQLAALAQQIEANEAQQAAQDVLAERERLEAQAKLRETYAQEARAALNDVQDFVARSFDTENPSTPRNVRVLFPELGEWTDKLDQELWEFERSNFQLMDYGLSSWRGRRMEAILVQTSVGIQNRTRGERSSRCMLIGYLIDAEFAVRRDPVFADCGDPLGQVENWLTGRNFESRWIAE